LTFLVARRMAGEERSERQERPSSNAETKLQREVPDSKSSRLPAKRSISARRALQNYDVVDVTV